MAVFTAVCISLFPWSTASFNACSCRFAASTVSFSRISTAPEMSCILASTAPDMSVIAVRTVVLFAAIFASTVSEIVVSFSSVAFAAAILEACTT